MRVRWLRDRGPPGSPSAIAADRLPELTDDQMPSIDRHECRRYLAPAPRATFLERQRPEEASGTPLPEPTTPRTNRVHAAHRAIGKIFFEYAPQPQTAASHEIDASTR